MSSGDTGWAVLEATDPDSLGCEGCRPELGPQELKDQVDRRGWGQMCARVTGEISLACEQLSMRSVL